MLTPVPRFLIYTPVLSTFLQKSRVLFPSPQYNTSLPPTYTSSPSTSRWRRLTLFVYIDVWHARCLYILQYRPREEGTNLSIRWRDATEIKHFTNRSFSNFTQPLINGNSSEIIFTNTALCDEYFWALRLAESQKILKIRKQCIISIFRLSLN